MENVNLDEINSYYCGMGFVEGAVCDTLEGYFSESEETCEVNGV